MVSFPAKISLIVEPKIKARSDGYVDLELDEEGRVDINKLPKDVCMHMIDLEDEDDLTTNSELAFNVETNMVDLHMFPKSIYEYIYES